MMSSLRLRRPLLIALGALAGFLLPILMGASAQLRAESTISPAQTETLEGMIHDYILKHPEVLVESLKKYQEQQQSEVTSRQKQAIAEMNAGLAANGAMLFAGNPKASVTIVEFFDYRCPYCKAVAPKIDALLKDDRDLRIVYMEFPILGPASLVASRAALAAQVQGKYLDFHNALMSHQGKLDDDAIYAIAGSVGLDVDRLKTDMKSPAIDQTLERNADLAEKLDVTGTPAFVVGNAFVPGAVDLDELKRLVASARSS
jgi:protein-disulfide isomerase